MPRATEREREMIARVAAIKSFDGVDPARDPRASSARYDALDETRAIARDYADRARAALAVRRFPAKEALEFALVLGRGDQPRSASDRVMAASRTSSLVTRRCR